LLHIGSLYFKGSVASDFALASGSRDTALTIRLTLFHNSNYSVLFRRFSDRPIVWLGR
jgi:hypothetical protein